MELNLKSIKEILEYDFFIPSYQRGYKWGEVEVKSLLEDIYEFSQKKEGFYCLQPIVIKKDGDKYRVIDGQQRLTTIYIILKYLEEARNIIFSDTTIFSLEYETRKNSKNFLENNLHKRDKTNPDFYYMSEAYHTIKNWFEENKINKADFLNALLKYEVKNNKDIANNVRFIWYELSDNENEIEVFTRLNIGKIPLSDSELIKAILLQGLSDNEKSEIIAEWDYIEKNLQNDRFFSFLTQKNYKNTRIDFIFELLTRKYNKDKFENQFKEKENDKRFSFYVFDSMIKKSIGEDKLKKKQELWGEVKEYFRIFEEVFNNNEYYHYVGYLTNIGVDIEEIINLFKTHKKDKFKNLLEEKMKVKINKPFKELNYEEDKKRLDKLLFLFNVIITMESGYSRYPFDIHKEKEWSVEHIHARNSEDIKESDRKKLLQEQLNSIYIKKEIKKEIRNLFNSNRAINKTEFEEIQEKIYEDFTNEKEDINTIDNLALLSKRDNSSLNNAIFPEKRAKIKELDEKGKFIPLGTKNVFMKYYSDKVKDFLKWNKEDRKAYLKILEKKLNRFVKVEE